MTKCDSCDTFYSLYPHKSQNVGNYGSGAYLQVKLMPSNDQQCRDITIFSHNKPSHKILIYSSSLFVAAVGIRTITAVVLMWPLYAYTEISWPLIISLWLGPFILLPKKNDLAWERSSRRGPSRKMGRQWLWRSLAQSLKSSSVAGRRLESWLPERTSRRWSLELRHRTPTLPHPRQPPTLKTMMALVRIRWPNLDDFFQSLYTSRMTSPKPELSWHSVPANPRGKKWLLTLGFFTVLSS